EKASKGDEEGDDSESAKIDDIMSKLEGVDQGQLSGLLAKFQGGGGQGDLSGILGQMQGAGGGDGSGIISKFAGNGGDLGALDGLLGQLGPGLGQVGGQSDQED